MAFENKGGLVSDKISEGYSTLQIPVDPTHQVDDPERYASQYVRCSAYEYKDISYSANSCSIFDRK